MHSPKDYDEHHRKKGQNCGESKVGTCYAQHKTQKPRNEEGGANLKTRI